MTNPRFRLFAFGLKLGSLLLALLIPVVAWYLAVFKMTPLLGQLSTFRTHPILLIGIYATEAAAKGERDRQVGRVVYEITKDDGTKFFALTTGSMHDTDAAFQNALDHLSNQYPDLGTNPPGLLQSHGRDPIILAGARTTAVGRVIQVGIGVVASLICFALYFPLVSSLIGLFRRSGVKQADSRPNKALESSAPTRE